MMDSKSCCQIESDTMVEILKNQLYFAVIRGLSGKKIKSTVDALYFSIDDEFEYQNYYYDFGPYNMSYLYKYCIKLNKYLEYSQGLKRVVHCTSTIPEKKVNAACLIGAYCIIFLKFHPAEVTKLFMKSGPYKEYMDASQIPCPYTIKLDYCFNAIAKAVAFNFFNFDDFDVTEYDMYEKLQFGDMNWLVPRKFLAFIGPQSNEYLSGHPPEYYIKYFLKNDIKTVIRLNNKMYDSAVFVNAGIAHYDLIYPDGTTPSKEILLKFLEIAETAPSALAVHCKAGLGRTGSLIGAYIIKHYKMTAKETIAWMRLCRPGSVIGQQQLWLEKLEKWLWRCGSQYRCRHYGDGDKIPRHKYGIYSKTWPVERSKILHEARRKYAQYSASAAEPFLQGNRKFGDLLPKNKPLYNRFRMQNLRENTRYEDISHFLTTVYGLEKSKSKYQNRVMNMRISNDNETKRTVAQKTRHVRPVEDLAAPPYPTFGNISAVENELQGDNNQYTQRNMRNIPVKKKIHSIPVRMPITLRTPIKIDMNTDTNDYVHSYMEEKAKRKHFSNRGDLRVTQGDRLLEKKIDKNSRMLRPKKDADSNSFSNELNSNRERIESESINNANIAETSWH